MSKFTLFKEVAASTILDFSSANVLLILLAIVSSSGFLLSSLYRLGKVSVTIIFESVLTESSCSRTGAKADLASSELNKDVNLPESSSKDAPDVAIPVAKDVRYFCCSSP